MDFFGSALFGSAPGVRSHAPGFLEGVVSDVLQPLLGNFVHGLDRENLTMSIWDGEVRLRDLALRTELLDALSVPFRVLGGTVGEIRVSVPWRNLGSEPMLVSIDRVLLLCAARSGEVSEEQAEDTKAEGKRALVEAAEAVEEQNAAGEEMGPTLVEKLTQALVQKLQVCITNVHVRIQGGPEADAIAGGAMIRSIRIDDPPQDKSRRPEPRSKVSLESELSRKRLSVDGLAVYLDTTAAITSAVEASPEQQSPAQAAAANAAANAQAAAAAAAAAESPFAGIANFFASATSPLPAAAASSSSSSSGGDAGGGGGTAGDGCMAEWEARMLAMISARAGPAHVIGPVDLTLDATFDLTGKVRQQWMRLPASPACLSWSFARSSWIIF